jgi:hypothetical protein
MYAISPPLYVIDPEGQKHTPGFVSRLMFPVIDSSIATSLRHKKLLVFANMIKNRWI